MRITGRQRLRLRHVLGLLVGAVLVAHPQPAHGDDLVSTPDPAGDCSASPCADLVAASASAAGSALVFTFDAVGVWGQGYTPLPEPQVWIWTTSPDTAPPDAVVGSRSAFSSGGSAWIADDPKHTAYDYSRLTPNNDGAPSTHLTYRIDSDFMVALHGRFRWRATLPADPNRKWDDRRPVDPTPADFAPDQGSIEFAPADRDGDAVPDAADQCPDEAYSDPLPGWDNGYQHRGCPVALAPFSRDAFVTSARRSTKAFLALWRDPRRRAVAYRNHRIDLAFRVPAGSGHVGIRVEPPPSHNGPSSSSVFGGRSCNAGLPCIMHLRLVPEAVRAYAHRSLLLRLNFYVGSGHRRVLTELSTRLRMPLPR
jgi:hypothetical protein